MTERICVFEEAHNFFLHLSLHLFSSLCKNTFCILFSPFFRYEEMLLVLMLSECIARKDAVLSQDPKFVSEREKTYKNATMTYDLIALSLVRFNQVFQIFRQITTLSFDVSEFDDFFSFSSKCWVISWSVPWNSALSKNILGNNLLFHLPARGNIIEPYWFFKNVQVNSKITK